ncbi:conjugal transfer protein TrbL family protein [Clostridium sp.]|uniref:conjugal transfer protein TrbL family protein n=1 Tax=Clostridium sp. TaxID=1506 RepID=UPI003F417CFE
MDILDVIGSTGSWIVDKVNEVFFGFINQLVESALGWAFELLSTFLIQMNDLNKYFDYSLYLTYAKYIAGGLLVVAIANEVLKQVSGNIYGGEQKSVGTITGQIIFSGSLIFMLPWSVDNVFMKINNALVGLLSGSDFGVDIFTIDSFTDLFNIQYFGLLVPLLMLTIAIGFLIIGVVGAIRYIELILAILIAPIVAISFVRTKEAIKVWVIEVVALTFTQTIHVLLLHMLIKVMTASDSIVKPLLVIGVLIVMIKGPKVLRQYLYSTGAVSATAGSVGSIAQIAVALK